MLMLMLNSCPEPGPGPEPVAAGSRIHEGITRFIRLLVQIFGEMMTLVVIEVLTLIVNWLQMQLIDLN